MTVPNKCFIILPKHMHIYKDDSLKCIWTLNPPPSSYFCNLMKNVKTNRDPLLAAAGVALLGGNSIRQMLVFLTQKPIFSSISYMRVLFEYMVLLELTLGNSAQQGFLVREFLRNFLTTYCPWTSGEILVFILKCQIFQW